MTTVAEKFAENPRDAVEKLSNIILRYKNNWVQMATLTEDLSASVFGLKGGTIRSLPDQISLRSIDTKDFDVSTYPLGYMSTEQGLYYLSRIPLRRNRFGLRSENTQVDMVWADVELGSLRSIIYDHGVAYGSLCETLEGNYSSFEECMSSVGNGSREASAFSHDFAVKRATRYVSLLMYKTDVAGELSVRDGCGELYPSFVHLAERAVLAGVPTSYLSQR